MRPRSLAPAVAVVGAGWAGLAGALALAEAGLRVTLFETAPQAGGRARSVTLATPLGPIAIDNGQHLIVGAYRQTLGLLARLGAGPLLRRHRLHLVSERGLSLRAAPLPAPLHLGWGLLRAGGLDWSERMAMLRMMRALRRAHWQVRPNETVAALLERLAQPSGLVLKLWAPLCVGALNTLPAHACARSFAAVLRDTLGAASRDCDFVAPDAPLGALLPDRGLARLRALGTTIRLRSTLRELQHSPSGWRLDAAEEPFAALLLALPPWSAAAPLGRLGLDTSVLQRFVPEPIATAWALWPAHEAPRLERWLMLEEDPQRARFGQWVFDRGILGPARVAGVVVSVASRIADQPAQALADGIAAQLRDAFGGPAPSAIRIVTERRATFRCTPGLQRPACDHFGREAPGLWLAGDYTWPDYPATIEAAVRSGQRAAAGMLASLAAAPQPQPGHTIDAPA